MGDGAAILKILSVGNFVLLHYVKNGILWSERVGMSSHQLHLLSNGFLKWQIPLAGLIEKHLDLGPTTDQLLKTTRCSK